MVRSSARAISESNQIDEANAVSSHKCRERVHQNNMLHSDVNAIALSHQTILCRFYPEFIIVIL